ncbi:DNA (cytosine-5)-methyltransferase CMT2-like isoform X2 [Cornus florida]|uniref:DNA (cytosine-5)-methyltransferase CMT2-like isoform X2 n=1 Tax=Cornus florida TaxID=4283 RepID=UPI002898B454|nr:DNA (cytosine-5)-methyltransferase CMT2-like isoform X2 [Cornus florida]
MAAENTLSRVSPRLSKASLSPSPSPLPQNGNIDCSASKISGKDVLRKSPRLCTNLENGYGIAANGNSKKRKPPAKKQKTISESSNKKKGEGSGVVSLPAESSNKKKGKGSGVVSVLIGDPVPDDEARQRWPWRYQKKIQQNRGQSLKSDDDDDDEMILNVNSHYSHAEIEKCVFKLGDCAYVKGKEGGQNFVGRILEFFKTLEGEDYFRVQWFFRAEDTVINEEAASHNKKRLFYSTLMNDNLLDCLVSTVKIVHIAPSVNLKSKSIPPCDFYYDMKYSVDYTTFCTMVTDSCNVSPSPCTKAVHIHGIKANLEETSVSKPYKSELALLDIYSGCGGMSTGLSLGAKLSGVDLATKWAVDIDKSACESLKLNHPDTEIRNESAEDFLDLLKEWDKLCKRYVVNDGVKTHEPNSRAMRAANKDIHLKTDKSPTGEYEVARLVDICYSDPSETGKRGLKFQVRWVGYGPSEDTWEPVEGLSKCQDRIQDFVLKGFKAKILPQPGDVDVICGGPPCQGISGYNRHRNVDSPLDDERNRQIVVFMDIVNFLKPKYVLMENVVDILRFAKGCLGRYAISRLVRMNYQARLGIMASGCYGLPQFRLRVFLWGAHCHEKLPQFPLPTHDVVLRYGAPSEFERSVVAYDESQSRDLEKALVLSDAISDLPPVMNHEICDKMSYKKPPETEFQKYIRATRSEMIPSGTAGPEKSALYDHRPLPLCEDDYLRVCRIPQRKGANFRDLPGIVVGADNVVRRDSTMKPEPMPSGKLWVPDYAINFSGGKSTRPFARLWWDETVPTVLCRPDPHSQAILHPEQDRVLTIRECARLQGFPDYYQFCGDVKERYCQVGNAVSVPVARALGYALGMAVRKLSGDEPLMTLPPKFSHSTTIQLLQSSSNEA